MQPQLVHPDTCMCSTIFMHLKPLSPALPIPRSLLQGPLHHSQAAASRAWGCCLTGSCLV